MFSEKEPKMKTGGSLAGSIKDFVEAVMAGVVRGWDSSSFYLRDEGGLKVECGPWQADRGSHLCSGERGDVWSLFRLRLSWSRYGERVASLGCFTL